MTEIVATTAAARAAIATWFGGPYNAATRRYLSTPPTVAGLTWVQPGFDADVDMKALFSGAGQRTAAFGVVHFPRRRRTREARGGPGPANALRRIAWDVDLDLYLVTRSEHAIDAEADRDALEDAVIARIEADPTFGGMFLTAGEDDGVTIERGQAATEASGITKSFLGVRLIAVSYEAT